LPVTKVLVRIQLGRQQKRRILQAFVSSTKLSVTDFIARYQYSID
jgi:hypothetical protein